MLDTKDARVIVCKVREVTVEIGGGNHLVLFQGDRVMVGSIPTQRKRFRVMNSKGKIIGYITKRSIRCIEDDPIRRKRKGGSGHAVEAA